MASRGRLFLGISVFVLLCVGGICVQHVLAANACVSIASGNWSSPSTWTTCGGSFPIAGDSVTIATGHTVTVDVDSAAASVIVNNGTSSTNLNISSAKTLTISGAVTIANPTSNTTSTTLSVGSGSLNAGSIAISGAATNRIGKLTIGTGTVTVTGSVTFSGTATLAQVVFTDNGTMHVAGNFGSLGTLTTTGGFGTIDFNGGAAQTIGTYTTYNNVQINNTSGNVTFTGTTTIGGTLAVNIGTLDIGAFAVTVTGATTVASTLTISSNTGVKTFVGAVTVNLGGTFTSTVLTTTGNLIFRNGITNNGTFNAGGATFNTNAQALAGTNALNFANIVTVTGVTVTNNTTSTLTSTAAASLAGTGTWTQGIGSTLQYKGSTLTVTTLDASTSTNTVDYNNAGTQTIKAPLTSYFHLLVSSSGVKTLAAATQVDRNLIVSGSASLADGGFQITGNATGTFSLGASTTLSLGLAAAATSFPTGFTATNTTLTTSSTVSYISTSAQTISNVTSYANLTLTGASVTKTAAGPITVRGVFTNTTASGVFDDGGFTITLNDASVMTGSATGTGKILFSGGSIAHVLTGTGSYTNLELNDALGITQSANTTINGTFTITNGTYTVGTPTLTVTGLTTIQSGGVLALTSATGAKKIGDLTMNGTAAITGATGILTFQKVGGGTISGTATQLDLGGSAVFTTDYTLPIPFSAVAVTVTGATVINSVSSTINGALSGTGTFTQNTSTTLSVRTISITTLNATAASNTVRFIGGVGGTIKGTTYVNVEINKATGFIASGSGTVNVTGNLTDISGTLNFSSSNFTVVGTTDIYDRATDSSGGPAGGNNILKGLVTVHSGANWAMVVGEVCDFHFQGGLVNDSTSFISSTGIYYFETNNQSITGAASTTIDNITASGTHLTTSNLSNVVNLTATGTGTGYVTVGSNLFLGGILTLSGGNPSSTTGELDMGSNTLTMGPLATTVGLGDVTGIVKRTSLIANTSYTFGNQFTTINMSSVGTLPSSLSFRISIGATPTWKTNSVLRKYSIIQSGASTSNLATIDTHYQDSELNGNIEDQLVYIRNITPFTPGTEIEFSRSNYDTTDNWVGISGIPVGALPSIFGLAESTLGNTSISGSTWTGASSTVWLNPFNWSPNGIPSNSANIIIPDASGTPNDPILPPNPIIVHQMTIESGGIVNTISSSTLTITGGGGAWSNNGGTFNSGTGTVVFTSATATQSGTTNFYNVTITPGATLANQTNSIMRIGGTMLNNGTWNAAQLVNTVEYNGTGQTILNPNGSTSGYYHLTLSGSGSKTLPATTLGIRGDFTLSGTASTVANATLNIGCSIIIGNGTTFDASSFSHTLGCNFVNNGTFTPSTSLFTFNGTVSQDISGTSPIAFTGFTLNNSVGVTLTGTNPTINGVLTLTSGNITTGVNNLYISSTGSVSRTSGHIVGNLRKFIQTGATIKNFEIGGATAYTPANIAFGNVTVAGDLVFSTTGTDQTNIATSNFDASTTVNRFWTASNSGVSFNTYDAVFTFANPGDLDSGVDPLLLIAGLYNGSWSYPTLGTRTASTTQITGLSGFGDFQLGLFLSSEKEITSFTILGNGTVTESSHTIAITVPYGTDVTNLTPTIVTTGASVSPASGVPQNFTTPQTYTVTAADLSTQAYIVTVTVAPAPTPGGGGGGGGGGGNATSAPYQPSGSTSGTTSLPNGPTGDSVSGTSYLHSIGLDLHYLVKLPSDGNVLTQEDSTVYYVGADGRRHAFPSPKDFFSWYCNFSQVRIISADLMAKLPLGRNVTYRPGLRLVKFLTVPTVYLVQANEVLRPIADEATARALGGSNWAKQVSDISDTFYRDYFIGASIGLSDVTDIHVYDFVHQYPSAEMRITGYIDPGMTVGVVCGSGPVSAVWPFREIPKTFSFSQNLSVNTPPSLEIRYLQELLASLGPDIYPEAKVTGIFGTATEAAVKRFQARNGLTQLGSVGPGTRQALNALLANYR